MKKFLGLLAFVFLLNGCDDGDITVETIDFADVETLSCEGLLTYKIVYKIKGNESLIIKLPATTTLFTNEPTSVPRELPIGGNVSMIYRAYSSTATIAGVCDSPPPISPVAILDWTATQGMIEVTTIPVYALPDPVTGQSKITNYKHSINVRGLKFAKPDGTDQIYPLFDFGSYLTPPTNILAFDFDAEDVKLCPSTNTLYNARNGGPEGLFVQNFSTTLLSTDNLGVPKTEPISETGNKPVYRYFTNNLESGTNEAYFCNGTAGNTVVAEEWTGTAGVNAIIEVTTVTNPDGPGFLHTVKLKGVTFKKQNSTSTFYYGNDILFGELITE